jgi:hypothetical protein
MGGRDVKNALFACLAAAAVFVGSQAKAEDAYYQGKQIRILVGFPPGGGTDLFGRVFVDRLGRYIDGKPSVIVQNMPGAGSVTSLNYYANVAPRDGTMIFVGTGNLLLRMLLNVEGTKAKVSDLEPLIAVPMGRITYAAASTGVKSPKDIPNMKEPFFMGITDPISTLTPTLQLMVLKAPFKTISGYPGKNDTRLALERGEISIDDQTTPVYLKSVQHIITSGGASALYAQGLLDGPNLVRDPAAPDVRTVADAYREIYVKDPAGPEWEAYKAVVRSIGNGGKILMIHKDTPDAARAALKRGIEALLKDPEFMKSAEETLEGYAFSTGDALNRNLGEIAKISPDTVAWLKTLLSSKFNMKFE